MKGAVEGEEMFGLWAVVTQSLPALFEENDGLVDDEDGTVNDALHHLM